MWIAMTKPKNTEQEFEEFMSGNSKLSHIYRQSQTDGPSELTDKRILDTARSTVATQQNHLRGKRWLIPAAIAASLVVISLVMVIKYQNNDAGQTDLAGQQSLDREVVSNLKPDPAHLLDEIVQLVKNGKITTARDQYRAFLELHPDYPIDYQRYPELEQFKQAK